MALLPALHRLRIDGRDGRDGRNGRHLRGGGCCTGVIFTVTNGEIRHPRASEPPWSSDETCPVCLEEFRDVMPRAGIYLNYDDKVVVVCDNGHLLHRKCHDGLIDNECPLCKDPLLDEPIDVHVATYDEQQALTSLTNDEGEVEHYEGERGAERKVRMVDDGHERFYEGERGAERKVRKLDKDGEVEYYEGEQGAEHIVRMVLTSGTVVYYEGELGAEHRVRMERPNGDVRYYEGELGAERLVRMERPNGDVRYYEGERKAERKVRVVTALGYTMHFTGEQGEEQLVKTVSPDGTVTFANGRSVRQRTESQCVL